MNVVHGVTRGKVAVWIPFFDELPGLASPRITAVLIKVVAKVPGDI